VRASGLPRLRPASPLSERAKNWATFAVSTLLALLLAEAASRILIARVTPAGIRFDDEILYTYAPRTELPGMVLNDVGCVGDDALGERSGPGGETRVLLLGGSTSFSSRYVASVKENLRREHPGREFRVMSCGKPRYTSFVNRVIFGRRASVWAPDVVVWYEGINDNIYNSFPWLDGLPSVGYFDWRTGRSSVLFDLLKYHLVDKALRSVPDFAPEGIRSRAIFEENLVGILETARSRNARTVLATFAIALPTDDRTLLARIRADEKVMRHFWGNIDSTAAGVRAHNSVVESLAERFGLPLARVAEAIPRDSAHFVDICHLTKAGNDRLGAVIAEAVGCVLPPEPLRTER
jgi:hypothetical protein